MSIELPLEATVTISQKQIKEILYQYLNDIGYNIKGDISLTITRGFSDMRETMPDMVTATIKVDLTKKSIASNIRDIKYS